MPGGKRGKRAGGDGYDRVKARLLTRKNPSAAAGIADASVIKDGDVSLVTRGDGSIPFEGRHGFGLYYRDCRYLDGYVLEINGKPMEALSATTQEGFLSAFELTNPALEGKTGGLHEHSLGLRWSHMVSHADQALRETLEVRNYGPHAARLELELRFRARFDDVFNIRGLDDRRPGRLARPVWRGSRLELAYRGGDGVARVLSIRFGGRVRKGKGAAARIVLSLRPEKGARVEWMMRVHEERIRGEKAAPSRKTARPLPSAAETNRAQAEERARHASQGSEVASDHEPLEAAIRQSLKDLRSLQSQLDGGKYFAAGIPWFATLFGRDALVSSLQTLAFDPDAALGTLRMLARLQGKKVDAWTEEQPGRILHEYRRGELAQAGMIPYTPFYGTVDATALFLILLREHADWTGSLDLFRELRGAVDLALRWMDVYGDANGDGYLEYAYPPIGTQINEGWKDAADVIVTGRGELAQSPISLVEVQAYAYRARLAIAGLLRRNGEEDLADELEAEADALRVRFNRDFWMRDKRFYALALHGRGRVADAVSSNPGHALWCGIADRARAAAVRERLMADDLYSGWGIRTLSARERAYNPVSYHLGSVWPHDNAFAAAGLRNCGYPGDALRIFEGLLAATDHFPERRLPELFCGFSRAEFPQPVRYPIACHPQAWASGSLPFLLTILAGLRPDAFARRLRIADPVLPAGCGWLEWRRLRVGGARADLRFERDGTEVRVRVLGVEGDLGIEAAEGKG